MIGPLKTITELYVRAAKIHVECDFEGKNGYECWDGSHGLSQVTMAFQYLGVPYLLNGTRNEG